MQSWHFGSEPFAQANPVTSESNATALLGITIMRFLQLMLQ